MSDCCDECSDLGLPIGPTGPAGSIIGAVARIVVPSVNILTLNTIPYTLLAAPGTGKAIKLITWSTSMTFNTAAYAANTTLQVYTETATALQGNDTVILTTTTGIRNLTGNLIIATGTTSTQIIANKPLLLNTLTGNPTTGDSDIILYLGYQILTL